MCMGMVVWPVVRLVNADFDADDRGDIASLVTACKDEITPGVEVRHHADALCG